MRKHSNHIIDEKARAYLRGSLPPEDWQVYDITPDYGKDFPVELLDRGGALTGQQFYVQLKGTKRLKRTNGGQLKFRIETKYLKYFEKLRQPLFLVVVDVLRRTGYWVFAQKYIREEMRGGQWRRQRWATVYIAASATLADATSLRAAVVRSIEYIAATFPAAVEYSIAAAEAELEALDPRFSVKLRAERDRRDYLIRARERVVGTMTFVADPVTVQRLRDLLERGLPVPLQPGQLKIDGSPLWSHLAGGMTSVKHSWSRSISMTFVREDQSGAFVAQMPGLVGTMEGGRTECRVSCSLPGGLGTFSQVVRRAGDPLGPFTMLVDLAPWSEIPLDQLPGFDAVYPVFGSLGETDRLRFQAFCDGEKVFDLVITKPPGELRSVGHLMEVAHQARAVAKVLGIDRQFPAELTRDDLSDISIAYKFFVKGRVELKCDRMELTTKFRREQLEAMLSDLRNNPVATNCRMDGDWALDFLGSKLSLVDVAQTVERVELLTPVDEIARRVSQAATAELVPVDWRVPPGGVLTIYRKEPR